MIQLEKLGLSSERTAEFEEKRNEAELTLGRITNEQRGLFRVATAIGERFAGLAGRLRHEAEQGAHPTVGDWVGVDTVGPNSRTTIRIVLDRTSSLIRKASGKKTEMQLIAANIDIVFVVASLGEEPNIRRIERSLALAWESGAQPVVVLNKSDLEEKPEQVVEEVAVALPGVPICAVSALADGGVEPLRDHITDLATVVLIGPSGVGKSSVVNALIGEELAATGAVREVDGKGRHTTTSRQLLPLPGGGVLIDTPGVRELGLYESEVGVDQLFSDLTELATRCRFTDCRHDSEPDCAIHHAVDTGEIERGRYDSWVKLKLEEADLERKLSELAKLAERRRGKLLSKTIRRSKKKKKNR